MQYVNCNLCGADDTILVTVQNNYRAVECKCCGLIYANPRPTPDALIALYNTYHRRNGKDAAIWGALMEGNFRETSTLLNHMFPEKGTLLDIGCGYGHFIEMMQKHGWVASGIEPSENTSSYAQAKGLDVTRTIVEDVVSQDNSFDAITAFYVLEHLFDPLAALEKIRTMLKPGGVLVLRVPHTTPTVKILNSVGIKNNLYDLPFHLYDFSPTTVMLLLEKAGFADITVTPGSPTIPPRFLERVMSLVSGRVAQLVYLLSGKKLLLPCVSKTIIAVKPPESGRPNHA